MDKILGHLVDCQVDCLANCLESINLEVGQSDCLAGNIEIILSLSDMKWAYCKNYVKISGCWCGGEMVQNINKNERN